MLDDGPRQDYDRYVHRHGPTPRLAGHLAKWWLALPVLLLTLALPAAAFGAATQTWVSGVGDDVNACTRTEPCKTFAGAISKTETGGEINVLDPGGFGAVTITKSITISAIGVTAGVLVSGTNGIVVSAPSTANVILRGLDFDGIAGLGLSGVVVNTAANVSIEDSSRCWSWIRARSEVANEWRSRAYSSAVIPLTWCSPLDRCSPL